MKRDRSMTYILTIFSSTEWKEPKDVGITARRYYETILRLVAGSELRCTMFTVKGSRGQPKRVRMYRVGFPVGEDELFERRFAQTRIDKRDLASLMRARAQRAVRASEVRQHQLNVLNALAGRK